MTGGDSSAHANSSGYNVSRGLEMKDSNGLDHLLNDQIDKKIDCG